MVNSVSPLDVVSYISNHLSRLKSHESKSVAFRETDIHS